MSPIRNIQNPDFAGHLNCFLLFHCYERPRLPRVLPIHKVIITRLDIGLVNDREVLYACSLAVDKHLLISRNLTSQRKESSQHLLGIILALLPPLQFPKEATGISPSLHDPAFYRTYDILYPNWRKIVNLLKLAKHIPPPFLSRRRIGKCYYLPPPR